MKYVNMDYVLSDVSEPRKTFVKSLIAPVSMGSVQHERSFTHLRLIYFSPYFS